MKAIRVLVICFCVFCITTACFAKEYPLSKVTQDKLISVGRMGIQLSGELSSPTQKHETEMPYETKLNVNIITDKLLLIDSYMMGINLMLKIESLHHSAGQDNAEAIKIIKDYVEAALSQVRGEKDFISSLTKELQGLPDEQKDSIMLFYNDAEDILGRALGEL